MASGNVLRGKKNGKNGFFPYPQRWNKNKSFGIKRMCQVNVWQELNHSLCSLKV